MDYSIIVRSIYELGQRPNQEDSIYPSVGKATEADRLFIVCDGMGGHEHGEVASATVCEAMSDYIKKHYSIGCIFTEQDFYEALTAAYDALDKKETGEDKKKMGTTLTFLLLHSTGAFIAHIGDSRVYHIRPSEKKILFKTRDHSLVNDLIAVGELTQEEAKSSPQRNVITRAMQPHQTQRCRADIKQIADILEGDWFMMCSDGMLEELEDQNIINILSDAKTTIDEKAEIMRIVSAQSHDNHSAHLINILTINEDNPRKTWFSKIFG